MADGEEDVPPTETPEETVQQEQHIPTTEERLEHCYAELGALRAEIAELRSHSHAELAHATHEHEEYSRAEHAHDIPHGDAERTTEPTEEHESGGPGATNDSQPESTHWYARKVFAR